MRNALPAAALILLLALAGCSEAQRARQSVRNSDRSADIRCTSYGDVTFQGRSTGRVIYERTGALQFVDAATGRLNVIEGECRVVYAAAPGRAAAAR